MSFVLLCNYALIHHSFCSDDLATHTHTHCSALTNRSTGIAGMCFLFSLLRKSICYFMPAGGPQKKKNDDLPVQRCQKAEGREFCFFVDERSDVGLCLFLLLCGLVLRVVGLLLSRDGDG